MKLDFARRFRAPSEVLARELSGESVLLDLNSGSYFGLDAIGTKVWGLLAAGRSLQEAHEVLLEQYDVEAEVLRADMEDLANDLLAAGLLEITGEVE